MRLPRMTTRRWMIAVAVVGLVMSAIVICARLKARHDAFLSRAAYHAERRALFANREWEGLMRINEHCKVLGPAMVRWPSGSAELSRLQAESDRLSQDALMATTNKEYHESMERKYSFAACQPWFTVEPDPPPPE